MQSRRWWILLVAATLLSAGVSSTTAATVEPIATATSPDGGVKAAGDIVTRIIKGGTDAQKASDDLVQIGVSNSTNAIWLFNYMQKEIAPRFEERIFNPSQQVPQNIQVVAIVALVKTQEKMNVAAFDSVFTKQLTNQNAAVRYWAAKGILQMEKHINGLGENSKRNIFAALTVAATTETSNLAQAQMVRALARFGEVGPVISILEKTATRFRYEAFSYTDVEAAVAEISALTETFKIPPKGKDLTESVKNAAWLASFAAQQAANAHVNKLADASKTFEGAKDIYNATVGLLNAVTKPGTFQPSAARNALELYDESETLTKKSIQAQADLKAIAAPPDVKLGGGPSPTPAPTPPTTPAPAATSTKPKA
jgi:hypothetical protein